MSGDIGDLVRGQRTNAALAWALVGLALVAAATSVLRGNLLWAAFAVAVVVLAALPALVERDPQVMLPWEVVGLTALPVLGRSFATLPVTDQLGTYLSVAGIALVVAVELHLFTPVRMSDRFAVAFVVVTTLAAAGLWAVVRWLSDELLGTAFLLRPGVPEAAIERGLMWEFVASTGAGLAAGLVFSYYVRRYAKPDERLPAEAIR